MNPVYFSLRKPGIVRFEIEVNLRARGTTEIITTQRERELAEWREKMASWKAEEQFDRRMSWINRRKRAYG
jgi:hypothetical protein